MKKINILFTIFAIAFAIVAFNTTITSSKNTVELSLLNLSYAQVTDPEDPNAGTYSSIYDCTRIWWDDDGNRQEEYCGEGIYCDAEKGENCNSLDCPTVCFGGK